MFNLLYNRYKIEVLSDNSNFKSLKEMALYEKIFLVLAILGAILSAIFNVTKTTIGSVISLAMIFGGIALFLFFQNRPKEKRRILEEIIEPSAKKRFEKVVNLLLEFDIDVNDEKQLDNLIESAQKEKNLYDIWEGYRAAFKGFTVYILLPISAILLNEFFKDADVVVLLKRATVIVLVCLMGVLFVAIGAMSFTELFNKDIQKLDDFIKDVENVKVFNSKVCKMVKTRP